MSAAAATEDPVTHRGAAVEVRHLSRTYDGRIPALVDVSFDVEPGSFLGITGPSGSGKSTLLQLIGGLDAPDAGAVLVDGRTVGPHSRLDYRRHTVGFVFQLHHLLPALSAQMNVEVALMPLRVPRRERRERARELLDEVGLAHRATHLPSQLSGGERQKVAIARALAHDPRLLLADEPSGALDSQATERILDLLRGLQHRRGMTLIVVTHDDAVTASADRLIHIVDGRVAPR